MTDSQTYKAVVHFFGEGALQNLKLSESTEGSFLSATLGRLSTIKIQDFRKKVAEAAKKRPFNVGALQRAFLLPTLVTVEKKDGVTTIFLNDTTTKERDSDSMLYLDRSPRSDSAIQKETTGCVLFLQETEGRKGLVCTAKIVSFEQAKG